MRPHVDLSTGKIYGCKKGSVAWWHEKGHIEFNNNPETSWLLMIKSYIFDIWMLSIMAAFIIQVAYITAVLLWGIYIGIMIYEEWWCNEYARKNAKNNKFK